MVTTGPKLLLLAMSGFVALMPLGSALMSVACVTTMAHVNHVFNHVLNCVLKYKDCRPGGGGARL